MLHGSLFLFIISLVITQSAGLSDLEKLLEIGREFFNESEFEGLTFDDRQFRACLYQALTDPYSDVIVVREGEKIAGYVIIFCVREYTKENIGEMYQFYVRPEYRGIKGKGVSRLLVIGAEARFTDWNCAVSYVSADPRMGKNNNSLFRNLWIKFGYQDSGIILTKDRHGKFLQKSA